MFLSSPSTAGPRTVLSLFLFSVDPGFDIEVLGSRAHCEGGYYSMCVFLGVQHNDLQMRQAVTEISELLIMGGETCSGSSRIHSAVVHA